MREFSLILQLSRGTSTADCYESFLLDAIWPIWGGLVLLDKGACA